MQEKPKTNLSHGDMKNISFGQISNDQSRQVLEEVYGWGITFLDILIK
jgi:hypothetical protein